MTPKNPEYDRLEKMLALQREFHDRVSPSLKAVSEAGIQDMIAKTARNIMMEGAELMNEVNWREWRKTKKDVDWPHLKEELSDIFLFLMNGILESGMDSEDFYQAVMRKIAINNKRQDEKK